MADTTRTPTTEEQVVSVMTRYHRNANRYRIIFLFLKSSQICFAASIPLVSLMAPTAVQPIVNGILGALIVIVEGFQGAFEFQRYWIRYRLGGLSLDGEKRLFDAKAGPYKEAPDRTVLLAERVDTIIRETQSGWLSLTERITGIRRDEAGST